MKDDKYPEFPHDLFVDDNGNPLVFTIPYYSERAEITKLIRMGGGIVTNISKISSIRLTTNSSGLDHNVHVSYIKDCVDAKKLLDINLYRQKKLSTKSYHINIMASPSKKSKMRYTPSEDEAIKNYIKEHAYAENYFTVKGVAIWKKMEREMITPHSWQSMKQRYLRHIITRNITINNPTDYQISHSDDESIDDISDNFDTMELENSQKLTLNNNNNLKMNSTLLDNNVTMQIPFVDTIINKKENMQSTDSNIVLCKEPQNRQHASSNLFNETSNINCINEELERVTSPLLIQCDTKKNSNRLDKFKNEFDIKVRLKDALKESSYIIKRCINYKINENSLIQCESSIKNDSNNVNTKIWDSLDNGTINFDENDKPMRTLTPSITLKDDNIHSMTSLNNYTYDVMIIGSSDSEDYSDSLESFNHLSNVSTKNDTNQKFMQITSSQENSSSSFCNVWDECSNFSSDDHSSKNNN